MKIKNLRKRLLTQGYKHQELVKLTSHFYNEKSDLFSNYNEPSITSFVSKVVFKD